ncbi:hypothetical protein TNCT_245351 [Trichonephila clavata]|uniref:Uncharacterized protein n=1 Tax=Trichonephila clavata TaxID=2740835 RepID=A0A8X6H9J2_TRICU|nr:hypothetical protein TNCT_245351 [Trichonephila clavata]
MEDKNLSNAYSSAKESEENKKFKNSESFSFVHTNATENFQIEFPPNENVATGEYASLNTPPRYSPTMEDIFIKTQAIDTSELDPFIQWQDFFDFGQSNLPINYIDSNGVSTELK